MGYTPQEQRTISTPRFLGFLTHPFRWAGLDPGYIIAFLTEAEYNQVNNNYDSTQSVQRAMTSLTLFKEKYSLPTPVHEFMTVFSPPVPLAGGSQVAISFNLGRALRVLHNEADAYLYHNKTWGKLWHELGHEVVGLTHTIDYQALPDHGGGFDAGGNPSLGCIMCTNAWFFCVRCRDKMRAIEPTVRAWATEEEKKDIKNYHLYSYLQSAPDWRNPQIHQPQQMAGNVPRP